MKTVSTLIAASALLALPQIASASTKTAANIDTCTTEIRSQIGGEASATDLDFKRVKGNSRLQTLTFNIEADGEKDRVSCKVRRDNSVEIVWGKKVQPKKVLSVKAEGVSSAGE